MQHDSSNCQAPVWSLKKLAIVRLIVAQLSASESSKCAPTSTLQDLPEELQQEIFNHLVTSNLMNDTYLASLHSCLVNRTHLDLSGCPITESGLATVESLCRTSLTSLDLHDCYQLRPNSFISLLPFENLKSLDLESCRISNEELMQLTGLSRLQSLNVKNCPHINSAPELQFEKVWRSISSYCLLTLPTFLDLDDISVFQYDPHLIRSDAIPQYTNIFKDDDDSEEEEREAEKRLDFWQTYLATYPSNR